MNAWKSITKIKYNDNFVKIVMDYNKIDGSSPHFKVIWKRKIF